MPNSLAVWRVLKQAVLGNQIRNGLTDTYENMPNEADDRMEEAAAAILENVAAAIDWELLLEHAYWRHGEVHPDFEPESRRVTTSDVCGECLMEALLSEQRYSPDWNKHPSNPMTRQKIDWPQIVADVLPYRAAARWHPYKDQETPK